MFFITSVSIAESMHTSRYIHHTK